MSDRQRKVPVHLDSGKIKALPDDEIKIILRGADDLIMKAGRTMLVKLLKGSKEKKILEFQLDKCPVYRALSDFSTEEITQKIDWMIEHDYLSLEYSGKLPFLVFTPSGWKIEKESDHSIYLRQKTYIDYGVEIDENGNSYVDYDIKCCGLPDRGKFLYEANLNGIKPVNGIPTYKNESLKLMPEEIAFMQQKRTIKSFKVGLSIPGKLKPKKIKGGVVLVNDIFTIK